METETINLRENPKEKANPLSSLLFIWTLPIFKEGYKKNLEISDLYQALEKDKSKKLGDTLERYYASEVEKCIKKCKELDSNTNKCPKPSLAKALLKTFKSDIFYLGFLIVISELLIRLTVPVLLGKLLEYFKHGDISQEVSNENSHEPLYYALGIIILNGLNVIFFNHYMLGCFHMGMRARVAVCSLIYRKSLKLSHTALGESAPGKVVNLLSNDVNRFDLVSVFLHYLWAAPLLSLFSLYFIYEEVEISGVVGVLVVFTVMPIQAYAGKLSSKFRLQTALKTDERVRLMGEIISGVQVIKMYAWEKPFQALVTLARKLELKVIRKTSYVRAVYMTFLMTTTRTAVYFCMLMMFYTDREITAAKMFKVATYFTLLSTTMSSMFVRAIAEIAEASVSLRRLETYLGYDEFIKQKSLKSTENDDNVYNSFNGTQTKDQKLDHISSSEKKAIIISKIEAKWLPDNVALTLNIDNLEISKSKLIGVIGPVGSGKSSLLQMILGELPISSGNIEINGTISYACQEPWVFGGTVRQNILFGLPYEKHRYNDVVEVCALLPDFAQLPLGDQTLIGERGSSLSGGQKARINLARAIYRVTDIYLLDDPLSAVDAHVGRHLFEKCICNYLRKKTVVLVTHQLHYLKSADHIVLLKDGKIEIQGSYNGIISSSIDFTNMLTPIQEDESTEYQERGSCLQNRKLKNRKNSSMSHHTQRSGSIASSVLNDDSENEEPDVFKSKVPQTLQAEKSSKNTVKGSVGMIYLRAGASFFLLFIILCIFFTSQILASAADYWMSYWTSQEELRRYEKSQSNMTIESISDNSDDISESSINQDVMSGEKCVMIYSIIIVLLLFCTFIRSISFYNICLKASQKLHDKMFIGIIRSPLRFFAINPSGRIMNRFSKDMGSVDEILPKVILDASQMILQMVGAIILTCYVNPYFVVPIAIIFLIFIVIRKFYLRTSKNIKRMEGIARSPVFTHLNATLQGLSTIRTFKAENILQNEFDNYQDIHTSAHYLFITTSSAFGLFLDLLCLILITFVIISFLYIITGVFGDSVGLAITQTLSLTFIMQWGIRQSAEVSNQLMAVERLVEYTQLPPEEGISLDESDVKDNSTNKQNEFIIPHKDWPEFGRVQFIDLHMKYSQDPDDVYVLKGLNCVINRMEKIGIVGRTGAGKSSIIQAMFRLAYNEGDIIIDNINTKGISIEDLRKRISIIPQDPVLFSGTLRRNLDPFEEYSDSLIWKALDEVELKDIAGAPGLDTRVMDGGSNFSVGQRQLLCLARAILRKNRLLMLDEATANVDPYTDNLIQQTIREKFANCTVLTIAHRLNTIMDSDKVLVMHDGKIAEFDHPHILLKDEDSLFYKLSQETGSQNLSILHGIAKDNYAKMLYKNDIKMIDE